MVITSGVEDILRFKLCPLCGYDLQELPSAHACPECGFVYTDATFKLSLLEIIPGSDRIVVFVLFTCPILLFGIVAFFFGWLSCAAVTPIAISGLVGPWFVRAVARDRAARGRRMVHLLVFQDQAVERITLGTLSERLDYAAVLRCWIKPNIGGTFHIELYALDRWNNWPSIWFEGSFVATPDQAVWIQDEINRRIAAAKG